ncbi:MULTISPECIES: haloalkane dehalogenase [unclassified Corallococcus]|uniref:haloalkane dehalogenase n=1 Tax=unclassified Corallococcus TaxID=2685029 RepID=UPI001A8D19FE|nr:MULTISPECIES: haloalkane dehalogenase [unclassified Corallococcus]MBN9686209.1 haloalkane dehalogenase [Corallococcus sp. NCSPR001]WAS82359.1 haloalkane dehalogenase [Corallococcus sp. NCRR]
MSMVHQVQVLDSFISYREAGTGSPIVFLHGNPTSSHVWRNVIPRLADRGRCLAPDLIGMGDSGKPDIPYRFADHARYLDAWFDALGLRDVVLVGYDWGGVLALDWARRHQERVRGVAVFETFLRPMRWSDWPPQGEQLFRALRTPGLGETLVLEQNAFLERSFANGVQRGLAESDRAVYQAPYPDAASRRPVLQWPREIPIDGEPADVAAVIERYDAWLAQPSVKPVLLLTFGDAGLNAPHIIEWARAHLPALEIVPLGRAGHHAPEDAPEDIARALRLWLDRHAG